MTTFIYFLKDRTPYLASLNYERGDAFEIRIENATPTYIRIGNVVTNTEDGVGRVKLSSITDGVYTPEVIFNDKSILLYPIRIALGKVTIYKPEQICAALGAQAYCEAMRIDALEDEVNKLKDAIYGKEIF